MTTQSLQLLKRRETILKRIDNAIDELESDVEMPPIPKYEKTKIVKSVGMRQFIKSILP